jgi:predicted negative regulator of RcsB-dependent stress response
MAYYDLEEQEQLAELKAWWKQWAKLIVAGIVLALVVLGAYLGWSAYKRDTAAKAAAIYATVTKAAHEGDTKKAREQAKSLVEQYPKTGYAPLAALIAARLSFEVPDLEAAKQHLQWVVGNARDEDLKNVAKLRLGAVLLDDKQYDEALKVLDVKSESPMGNLYADLRGDVYFAKGALAEARSAYQSALERTDTKSPYRNLIQIKIDSLGEGK